VRTPGDRRSRLHCRLSRYWLRLLASEPALHWTRSKAAPALRPLTRYLGDSARRADYYCGNELPRWAALLRLARGPLWPAS
jgi:hypothetical protein